MVDDNKDLNIRLKEYVKDDSAFNLGRLFEALELMCFGFPVDGDMDLFIEDLDKLCDKYINQFRSTNDKNMRFWIEQNFVQVVKILRFLVPVKGIDISTYHGDGSDLPSYRERVSDIELCDKNICHMLSKLSMFAPVYMQNTLDAIAKRLLLEGVQSPELTSVLKPPSDMSYLKEQRLENILNTEHLYDGARGTEYGLKTIYALLQSTDFTVENDVINILYKLCFIEINPELASPIISTVFSIANNLADKNVRNLEQLVQITLQLDRKYSDVLGRSEKYLHASERYRFIKKYEVLQKSSLLRQLQIPRDM